MRKNPPRGRNWSTVRPDDMRRVRLHERPRDRHTASRPRAVLPGAGPPFTFRPASFAGRCAGRCPSCSPPAATRRSCGWSPPGRVSCSTSAGEPGWCRRRCAARWRCATAAARSPGVTGRRPGATRTTWCTGHTADPPPCAISRCSAVSTTTPYTTAAGPWPANPTANGTPTRRPGPSTYPDDPEPREPSRSRRRGRAPGAGRRGRAGWSTRQARLPT